MGVDMSKAATKQKDKPLIRTPTNSLRSVLKRLTWADICESTGNPLSLRSGIWFYGRLGCFLGRPCVAVCAAGSFAYLQYNDKIAEMHDRNFLRKKHELDGSYGKGLTLFEVDLPQFGIEPNSLVLRADNTEGE